MSARPSSHPRIRRRVVDDQLADPRLRETPVVVISASGFARDTIGRQLKTRDVFSKPLDLLSGVKGIRIVTPERPDECCGFGGTFSVFEEPVSAKMGYDKVLDHQRAGAEYIVSADMSCLMHQKGCADRLGLPIRFIHIAQVLNGARE